MKTVRIVLGSMDDRQVLRERITTVTFSGQPKTQRFIHHASYDGIPFGDWYLTDEVHAWFEEMQIPYRVSANIIDAAVIVYEKDATLVKLTWGGA